MPVVSPAPRRAGRRASLLTAGVLAGLLAGGVGSAALAGPTTSDVLQGFNLITSGNASTPSDVDGALLVGGNLTASGTLDKNAQQPAGSMGGTQTTGYGGIDVYGTAANTTNTASGVTVDVAGTSSGTFNNAAKVNTGYTGFTYAFSTVWNQLTSLSSSLVSLVTTGSTGTSISSGGNPTITASPTTMGGVNVAVLNITGADLSTLFNHGNNFQVALSGATLLVVNVDTCNGVPSCSNSSFTTASNINFNNSGLAGNLLWNFYDASNVTFSGGFDGTVLAPNATVSNGSPINGTVVAANYTGGQNGELHSYSLSSGSTGFLNSPPTSGGGTVNGIHVPEPPGLAVLATGLAGLLLVSRRRRA